MIDLHTHILPGVDDGPQDLDGAIAMARAALAAGVRVVAATPHALGTHLDVSPDVRDASLTALRAELARLLLPLHIVAGFECQVVDRLPETLTTQPAYLYAGGPVAGGQRHVLIELRESLPVTALDDLLFRLQMLRITPVLAHPERHPGIARSVSAIEGFVRRGGKLQITASALLGDVGWRERRVCEALLGQGLAGVMATDAHGVREAGSLGLAVARATKLLGAAAAAALVTSAPAAILGLDLAE
jgi:protein-tyrosine phosphatase